MNTLQLKGNWNIAKGKLKQKYAQLTDEDLRFAEGEQDELIGRIQKRTGDTKEMIEQVLNECFASDPSPADMRASGNKAFQQKN
jgi:uncharacterized protein YjbJ (UPF0337 family)